MTAYVLVDNVVQDPEQYALYIEEIAPTVAAFGGRYLVRGGEVVLTDSNWQPARLVLIEFASSQAALAWVEAPELQSLHQRRRRYAESRMVVVEGAPTA